MRLLVPNAGVLPNIPVLPKAPVALVLGWPNTLVVVEPVVVPNPVEPNAPVAPKPVAGGAPNKLVVFEGVWPNAPPNKTRMNFKLIDARDSIPLAGRLRCCGICTKAAKHRIGNRLLLGLLLAECCPSQVKSDKKRAMREMTHFRSDQIHRPGQRRIR